MLTEEKLIMKELLNRFREMHPISNPIHQHYLLDAARLDVDRVTGVQHLAGLALQSSGLDHPGRPSHKEVPGEEYT